jgi:hypothetical protein
MLLGRVCSNTKCVGSGEATQIVQAVQKQHTMCRQWRSNTKYVGSEKATQIMKAVETLAAKAFFSERHNLGWHFIIALLPVLFFAN